MKTRLSALALLTTIVLSALVLVANGPALAQAPLQIGAPAQFPLGGSPNALAHGDFDGDGLADVASANSGFPDDTLTALLNDGTGRFGAPVLTTLSDYPLDLASADFNRDGSDDLVVSALSHSRFRRRRQPRLCGCLLRLSDEPLAGVFRARRRHV